MKRLQLIGLVALALVAGCRGSIKNKPPIHLVHDMDFQQKIKAQSAFEFAGWKDGRGMRMPVEGTVAQGSLANAALDVWKSGDDYVAANPIPATMENFRRGQERFNIYCATCHDRAGAGQGLVLQRAGQAAFAKPPDLAQEDRVRNVADGHLYETIKMGRGTMPAYGHMVTVEDRWCIVHYLRALQNRIIKQ